ncbi:hypothetical protein Droror1_Dr00018322 [Drosera rotundifolia]
MIPPSSPQSSALFLLISSLHANADAVLTSPLGVNSRIIYFSRIASSRQNSIRRCSENDVEGGSGVPEMSAAAPLRASPFLGSGWCLAAGKSGKVEQRGGQR